MLAPNWNKDHDPQKNPIINYFADRFHNELILRKVEKKVIEKCFYCRECENYKKLSKYNEIFKQQGFGTFNKQINCWNVFDPDWFYKNELQKLFPVRKIVNI